MNSKIKQIFDEILKSEQEGIVDSSIFSTNNGFSGKKIIGLLQRLASIFEQENNICYLEVGVFRGLSLLSTAISSPQLSCFGIDNFAYLDPNKENLSNVQNIIDKYNLSNVTIINSDYEDAFGELKRYINQRKIAVYFIDGPHDYRSQLLCLNMALPYLSNHSVIVIDDCNYQFVRQANRDFLTLNPEWKLAFEAYSLRHPNNMTESEYYSAREGWWNGVNVIVRDERNELLPTFPHTNRNRILFENEQILHGTRVAELTPQIVRFVQTLIRLKVYKAVKLFLRILIEYTRNREVYKNRFEQANTFSETLPVARLAQFRNGI